MNDKAKKKIARTTQTRPKLGPKATARAEKRAVSTDRMLKNHQDSLRLREYVSVGTAELLDMYNTAARVKVQDKTVLVPRRSVLADCPFDQDLKGELIVMRSVAEMLQLTYTELTGEQQ